MSVFCQTIKNTNMKNIEFIPKEFNNVELGYYETSKNPCSPGYPRDITDVLWNEIVINAPRKIICTNSGDTLIPVIPICGAYIVTSRRESKYYEFSARIFHIKKINEANWFTGKIEDKNLQYEFPILPPTYKEDKRQMERERIEAQNLSDEELDEGQASGNFFNVNLMEYVEMPFEPGIYEIYLSFSGLESNRVKVEIVFEKSARSEQNTSQTEELDETEI
jgi:hypothetical protein